MIRSSAASAEASQPSLVQFAYRYALFRHGQRPNELMVKRLGMFGCTFLVLVHSVKDRLPTNSYAGASSDSAQVGLRNAMPTSA